MYHFYLETFKSYFYIKDHKLVAYKCANGSVNFSKLYQLQTL